MSGATPQFSANRRWAAALALTLATFMDLLDISVANVSLPHIAGNLGITADEATWVLTSYLAALAISMPASAWLASAIGRKRFYLICVAVFTVTSLCCGLSRSFSMLLGFRCLQGLAGGGLAPTEQAILTDMFPESERARALALYGMAAVLAPAIGPWLGGWITDNFTWRWIFLINVPLGCVSLAFVSRIVPSDERSRPRTRADYGGMLLIALSLGCFQVVFDRGQQQDWFSSALIRILTVTAVCGLVCFIAWELDREHPAVNIKLFGNRNFLAANIVLFVIGLVYFGITVMLPAYLEALLGYPAQQAGSVLSIGAIALLILMPVAGWATGRCDSRVLLAAGLLITAVAAVMMTRLNTAIDFRSAALMRAVQCAGIPFLVIPAAAGAYTGIGRIFHDQVSMITNVVRTMGASAGVSVFTTWIARGAQQHRADLVWHASSANPAFIERVHRTVTLFSGAGLADSLRAAQKHLERIADQQAAALSCIDLLWVCVLLTLCLFPALALVRPRAE
jgi:MFS transporter, DHA2 family, multidrug resistance protein